eukprot:CAMPEP_0185755432 /NCGR_PEP_ID=MMETSP1174-20130828/13931_1 /TAXON_ID=35687 /ORGANISM="Dictyocha speculum, Strain CCMP1381" /LENGTH=265 /DNA_ID=CAMNT_0028433983 /DNA_START=6 /DNA_END=803 /DNA_ORIENTATION=-
MGFPQGKSRSRVFFSSGELKQMKKETHCSNGKLPTTNAALCARLCVVIGSDVVEYTDEETQISVAVNLREPRCASISKNYIGNSSVELVWKRSGPWSSNSLVDFADQFQAVSDNMRNDPEAAVSLFTRKQALLRAGKSLLTLDPFNQYLVTNSQSGFPMLDVDFGAGECYGVIPQNLGDHIQIVPAPGGVHVYLNLRSIFGCPTDWMERVESSDFRQRVLMLRHEVNQSHISLLESTESLQRAKLRRKNDIFGTFSGKTVAFFCR